MLNIGRMGRGSARYYLDAVAHAPADYYHGHGEAPGRWIGSGLDGLGLELGLEVTREALGRVLDGDHPVTGERVAAHPARQVPGFDLTFRAPKSVSLLWGLGDEHVAGQVQEAHDAAVTATLGYLEQHVARSRRGAGGVEQVAVDGLVAASFTHRTSRDGDPLLHTHLLVANLARASDDGVWRTVDSRRFFTHAKTAGTLYQAHLRDELTRRLGIEWQPVVNGCADLKGVPREWIEAFSKRRAAIVAHMEARGETSAAAAQVATLDTRQAKAEQQDDPDLRQRWTMEARGHGIPDGWWTDLLDRQVEQRHDLAPLLVAQDTLTEHTASFAHRDVVRTIAGHAPDGAAVGEVLEVARIMGRTSLEAGEWIPLDPDSGRGLVDVIKRADGTTVNVAGGDRRFTTRQLLALEQTTVSAASASRERGVAVVSEPVLTAALERRPRLGDDQAAMVRRLARDGDGVAVVIGKAGTGKTYALDAAREAWEASGVRVTGVALGARAALELRDSAGIESTTLARLLAQLDDPARQDTSPLQPGQVLVVDEAGMIGTRQLARLLQHADAQDVKVVLVGDPHQLPEIDAGGLFTALTRQLPAIELEENRRQAHQWEQATLDELRHGDPQTAVHAYAEQGRLVTADTVDDIRTKLVADWWDAFDPAGPDRAVMVALRRGDVDDLNHRARAHMHAAGRLTGPTLTLDDGTNFQAGDRVVCLRNDRPAGLVNGLRGTVTAVHADATLTVIDDHDVTHTIPTEYLEAGRVAHGYAITGHKAQGLTVDHTFVLGSDALYREWGYVAMSRGRESNQLYVHTTSDMEPDAHLRPDPVDPVAATVTRLSRSRAEQPVSDETLGIAVRWRELHARLAAPDIARREQLAGRRTQLAAEIESTRERVARLEGQIDGLAGGLGRWRNRHDLAALERDRDHAVDRLADLDTALAQVDRELTRLPSPQQIDQWRQQLRQAHSHLYWTASIRVATYDEHCPPDHISAALGPPPPLDEPEHGRWAETAFAIEQYRLRWTITDPHQALGDQPADPLQRADYLQTALAITRHHRDLEQTRGIERGREVDGPDHGLSIGLSR